MAGLALDLLLSGTVTLSSSCRDHPACPPVALAEEGSPGTNYTFYLFTRAIKMIAARTKRNLHCLTFSNY